GQDLATQHRLQSPEALFWCGAGHVYPKDLTVVPAARPSICGGRASKWIADGRTVTFGCAASSLMTSSQDACQLRVGNQKRTQHSDSQMRIHARVWAAENRSPESWTRTYR